MRVILSIADSYNGYPRDILEHSLSTSESDIIIPITLDTVEKEENGFFYSPLSLILDNMHHIFDKFIDTQVPLPIGQIEYQYNRSLDMIFMPMLLQAVSKAIGKKIDSIEDIKNNFKDCFVVSIMAPILSSAILSYLFIKWAYNNGMTVVEPFWTERPPYFTKEEYKDLNYLYFLDLSTIAMQLL